MEGYAKRLRLLAIDPGPTWMGWCVLDVRWEPGVRTTFIEGGHAPCDYEAFRRRLTSFMSEHDGCDGTPDACIPEDAPPLALAIETPAGFAFQPSRVPPLLLTAVAAGGMAWLGMSRGLQVVQASAQQVRKVLAGKSNADDLLVRDTVEAHVFGARGASNDHVRDAVAMGLLGAWILTGRAVLPVPAVKTKTPGKGRKRKAVASGKT